MFLQYGPIPRLCINCVEDTSLLDAHQSRLKAAISSLTWDLLLSYIRMGESLDMELSHTIILVTRENVDDLFKFNIEPISLSVNRLMKQRLLEAGQKERLRTYMLHEKVEDSRIVLGILFEALAQIQLQKEVDLNLVRMVKESTQRGNDKWKSRPSSDTSS